MRRASLYGTAWAVSTGHHLASGAAMRQLARGGSLVDAMIAASAVMTVALPHATTLGGCGMMLIHDARTGMLRSLDGSGRAPARAVPAVFGDRLDARGPRSWVVPGLVRLWAAAHREMGRLRWASLFDDAIELAERGMGFSSELARNLALASPEVRRQPGFADAFQCNGQDREAGSRYRQPALAWTLATVAAGGEDAFYDGPVAQRLARFAAESGALLGAEDIGRARADWGSPVLHGEGRWRTAVMPPNSVGVLMQAQWQALGDARAALRAERQYRQIVNAQTLLPRLRDRVADPQAVWPWPGDDPSGVAAGPGWAAPGDTAGIVIADGEGGGLVLLQSVFQPFGSGCVDPGTGILMNNRLQEFSLNPQAHNLLAPGRRPIHTLNPYMAFEDGQPVLYAVSPGGVSQTTTGLQCLCNVLLDGMALPAAIDAPRWSLSRDGDIMSEPGFDTAVLDRLAAEGRAVTRDSRHPYYFGSIKAVRRLPDGVLEAAADLRREASAAAQ